MRCTSEEYKLDNIDNTVRPNGPKYDDLSYSPNDHSSNGPPTCIRRFYQYFTVLANSTLCHIVQQSSLLQCSNIDNSVALFYFMF